MSKDFSSDMAEASVARSRLYGDARPSFPHGGSL